MLSKRSLLTLPFAVLVLSLAMSGTASAQWSGESEDTHRRLAEQHRSQSKCGDLWVSYAFSRVTAGGYASAQACNIGNYNNGQWNTLSELLTLMECYLHGGNRPCQLVEYSYRASRPADGVIRLETLANGNPIGSMDINAQSGRIIAAGGGNLVGNDGASMVAAGGGNLVGNDGASMVAAGGGNLLDQMRSSRSLMSVPQVRVGRGLYQYGATVRGKEGPQMDVKIPDLKITLFGAPLEIKDPKKDGK